MVLDFVLDEIATIKTWQKKFDGMFAEGIIDDERVLFLKPMQFMNRSWQSVAQAAHFYKIKPEDILVLHDEIDFPVAKIQLKKGGSSAGHNGLKDIIAKLGTADFRRLRIGIDRPEQQAQVADYVLHAFKKEEKAMIFEKQETIVSCVREFLS